MTQPHPQREGISCSGCHKDTRSGYFLCDDCYAKVRLCDDCNIIELEEKLINLEQELKDAREQIKQERGWDQGFEDGKTAALVDLNIIREQARKAERERVLDELGVLHGEDAKRFQEMLNNPPQMSEEARELIKSALKLSKSLRGEQR